MKPVPPGHRATSDTEVVVASASARIACFSSADQDRRVPATTTCGGFIGPDIVPTQRHSANQDQLDASKNLFS